MLVGNAPFPGLDHVKWPALTEEVCNRLDKIDRMKRGAEMSALRKAAPETKDWDENWMDVGQAPEFPSLEELMRPLPPLNMPDFLSDEAKHFVESLFHVKPSERMPLKDVPNHPWIQKYAEK